MQYKGLELDKFQEDAVKAIDDGRSLIVSAPTGCGKTLIAEYAVEVSRKLDRKVIYTAPIKALSNQKFRDFKEQFGDDVVGIHTGDVTINPDAPLLIMTTEIFRNQILEQSDRLNNVYYAVFDEVHFIDDEERGTVWEESIILAPRNIRFLCLSATVPNIDELADWMSEVRDSEFRVIKEFVRPVPLEHHFYSPFYGDMNVNGIKKKYKRKFSERKKFLHKRPSSKKIVDKVLKKGHSPVLYFCFNRRACERNAHLHSRKHLLNNEEQSKLTKLVDELVATYNIEGYEKLNEMKRIWHSGCAFHHAGILPAAKEIVERLFSSGLIKLLFCTETFALGVNMPASAVIFDELEKFNGVGFEYLTSRSYLQMAGRAGRRGMDKEGHVYSQIVPEATDPREVERLLRGKSEKIRSRFFASYATILNLYSQYGEEMFSIFEMSLRNYYKGEFSASRGYLKEEEQIRCRLKFLQSAGFLENNNLTEKGKLAASVNGYEIQAAELYYKRALDGLTPEQLCVLLAAIVTEEKKRSIPTDFKIKFDGEKIIKRLKKTEMKFGIINPIRELDLSLAAPIYAWASGCSLSELGHFRVPEGDLIRLFRMVIQLLKTLKVNIDDPVTVENLKKSIELINRDVVDAQAELEKGIE